MKLTGRNTKYDASSGAFLVQQSDEMKLLAQIAQRLERMEAKLDALTQGSEAGRGRAVGK